ncbi:hypothetical protein [Culturomica massiliensis]|uniref:hypothetical protein n=1 Tax=Culturomica massiliensis TaxID=1841857 RepID=UPI003AEF6FCB
MKNIILIILSSLFICCRAPYQHDKQIPVRMEIDFQDFFKDDTISVKINNCLIIENSIITSEPSIGLTKCSIRFINSKDVFIEETNKILPCPFSLKRNINILVTLNKKEILFNIDLRKGHFIGFDKKGNELDLLQSKTPFEYD